jgi:hypothetical protein
MTEPLVFVLFNFQDRMFCDFTMPRTQWEAIERARPTVLIPRRRHPALRLAWPQLKQHLQVFGDERARAFQVAYDGLQLNGTVDLPALLEQALS